MPSLDGIDAMISALDWTSDHSREVVAVFYGYFDDSGSDKESPIALMAGYVAHAADWKKFENKSKRLFEREEVSPYFRAKLFSHTQTPFDGWTIKRKKEFAGEWYGFAHRHLMRGISAGAVKSDFVKGRQAEHRKLPKPSVVAHCLHMALTHLCKDGHVWTEIEKYGLHLVIEASTPSVDDGIRDAFDRLVAVNKLEKHLRSLIFAKKESSRALQLADYLAYYSHRFALTAMHRSLEGRTPFLDIAQSSVETLMKLGEKFSPNPDYHALFSEWKRKGRPA
jgi:hypothetical protein